jgi:DtxR family transcriptional regulator, Mn-dependent transcriptional regulator
VALTEAVQDYLEKLYWFEEASIEPTQANLARAMGVSQPSVTEMVRRLVDDGLVERGQHRHLQFTRQGRETAKRIVSRHRLLEAFLTEVFEIPWDEVHEEAHSLEHRLSESVEQRMYTMMANARACPHGHPIGDEPREAGEPLSLVQTGSVVTLLRFENEDQELLRLFRRAGLQPGAQYTLLDSAEGTVRLRAADAAEPTLAANIAGTISVRVETRGTGPAATSLPATAAAAALLGETSWGM